MRMLKVLLIKVRYIHSNQIDSSKVHQMLLLFMSMVKRWHAL